jgi:hypothetical protein
MMSQMVGGHTIREILQCERMFIVTSCLAHLLTQDNLYSFGAEDCSQQDQAAHPHSLFEEGR